MRMEEHTAGNVLVLRLLDDRLDAEASAILRKHVDASIDSGQQVLLMDLSAVHFIDSSGLGALVGLLKRLRKSGDLALCGLTPRVQKLFALTLMDRVFHIFPDESEALRSLAGGA